MPVTIKPVPMPKPELRQKLQLSPAFFNALKILEMNGEQMQTMLEQQAASNPFICLRDSRSLSVDAERMVQEEDPRQDLLRQVHEADCDQRIGTWIIDSLDSHGWFTIPVKKAAKDLRVSMKEVKAVLQIIQTFEPAGVGAVSLEDCLLLQIQRNHGSKNLCKAAGCLDLFARGQFQKAASVISCSKQEAVALFHQIQKLNPYPVHLGNPDAMTLFPDVTVHMEHGELTYSLYAWEESFTVSDGALPQESAARQLQKLCRARTVMLQRIVDVVLNHQQEYFAHGALRPLTCSTIAKELNVSVSTVTRALAHKAFEFDDQLHPFSDLLSPDAGGDTAQKEIMNEIRQLIQQEDPAHPYSDQKLCDLLQERGIHISKRTVTKYRMTMHILSYSKRRKY